MGQLGCGPRRTVVCTAPAVPGTHTHTHTHTHKHTPPRPPQLPLTSVTPHIIAVTPERRGDLVQEGYCSGVDLVASSGGAGRTVRQLAEHYNVPINDFLRINTHITVRATTRQG